MEVHDDVQLTKALINQEEFLRRAREAQTDAPDTKVYKVENYNPDRVHKKNKDLINRREKNKRAKQSRKNNRGK